MIYLKNNTETQSIYIPRQTILGGGYIASTKTYEDGLAEGIEKGKKMQKGQLLNLYVSANGKYEREDGWGVVTVDVPTEGGDCSDAYNEGYNKGKDDGYDSGFQDGYNQGQAECPELTEISITENGRYEGAYNVVNVDVPTEGGSCNLEDKWVTPSMSERDDNGLIVVSPSEGYDGLSRTVINPQTIYNEGVEEGRNQGGGGCNLEDKIIEPTVEDVDSSGWLYVYPSEGYNGMSRTALGTTSLRNSWYNEGLEAGRAEGGEGGGESGSCNLGVLDWTLDSPYGSQKNASDDGYDGYSTVVVRPENVIAQEKENAINDFKNKMKEITITENGTYSIDDQVTRQYVEFDGNSYFDTGIASTENMKIEVAITKTTYEEDEQFIGCAQFSLLNNEPETYGGFGIVAGAGLTYGCFGQRKTGNIPFSMEEEQILTLDRTGLESSLYGRADWSNDGDLNYGLGERTIAIGKINSRDGWIYRGLNGRIRYVKIWTNKDDDSTMVLFKPKNMAQGGFGLVNSEGTEYNYIENLGSGTATFVDELVKKYPNGFKRVEVNVIPSAIEGMKFGNSTFEECPFNLERIEDFSYLFENCKNLRTTPSIQKPIRNARSMFSGCSSLTNAPIYNTSEATDLGGMYAGCHNLTSVGAVDCSSLPNSPVGWKREAEIFDTNQYPSLTDFGGFLNLKQTVDLSGLIALSSNSVESIFNNLYDFSRNGETPNEIQGKITMSSSVSDAVEQYRSIAENKSWTVIIK